MIHDDSLGFNPFSADDWRGVANAGAGFVEAAAGVADDFDVPGAGTVRKGARKVKNATRKRPRKRKTRPPSREAIRARRVQIIRLMAASRSSAACKRVVAAERARDGSNKALWSAGFERVITGTCARKPGGKRTSAKPPTGRKTKGVRKPGRRRAPAPAPTPASAGGMSTLTKVALAAGVVYGARELGVI